MERTREIVPSSAIGKVEELKLALPGIAEKWAAKDIYASRLAEALIVLLNNKEVCHFLAAKLFAVRDIDIEYAFNLIRTTIQVQLAPNRDTNGYPTYETTEEWVAVLEGLFLKDGIHLDEIEYALENRDLQTNIEDRYKLPNAILAMFRERFGPRPRMIDLGAAQNRGLTAIVDSDHSFEPLEVIDDPEVSAELNRWINAQVKLSYHMGIDAWELRDTGNAQWALYNGYPSEQEDPDYEARYQRLIEKRDELGVGFLAADIINDQLVGTPEIPEAHSADVVFCSMLLYQHSQEGIDAIITKAEELLHQKGLFIIFDAVQVNPDDPNELTFSRDHAIPYSINLLIKDMAHPELGYQQVLSVETGRALRAKVGLGYQAVKNSVALNNQNQLERAPDTISA